MLGYEVHAWLERLQGAGADVRVERGPVPAAGAGAERRAEGGEPGPHGKGTPAGAPAREAVVVRLRLDGAYRELSFPADGPLAADAVRTLQHALAHAFSAAGHAVALRPRRGSPVAELGLADGPGADRAPVGSVRWLAALEEQLEAWLRLTEGAPEGAPDATGDDGPPSDGP